LFLGRQFGIATSVVLLSVLLWGWVWGPLGMLIAVPITVLIKLALKNSPDLSWVAQIIDDTPAEPVSEKTTKH
jgi:AI-2 transport protein TqsA